MPQQTPQFLIEITPEFVEVWRARGRPLRGLFGRVFGIGRAFTTPPTTIVEVKHPSESGEPGLDVTVKSAHIGADGVNVLIVPNFLRMQAKPFAPTPGAVGAIPRQCGR